MRMLMAIICMFAHGCLGGTLPASSDTDGEIAASDGGNTLAHIALPDGSPKDGGTGGLLAVPDGGSAGAGGDGDGDGTGGTIDPGSLTSGLCEPCDTDGDCDIGMVCDRRNDSLGPSRCLPTCEQPTTRDPSPRCDAAFGSGDEFETPIDSNGAHKPPWICGDGRDNRVCEPLVDTECIDDAWTLWGTIANGVHCAEVDLCELWLN